VSQTKNKKDYRAALSQIESLQQANQGLREMMPENRVLSDE